MTPPRDRHPFGWTAVVVALVLVAVLYVGLLVRWPVAGAWVSSNLLAALVASWATGRNLRAELEAARYRLATYNGSETHEALAEVGPVTGPTNVVELFDGAQLAEWSESGFRPQRPWMQCNNCDHLAAFTWSDNGVPHAACEMCVELWWPDGIDLGVVTDLTRPDDAERQALNEQADAPACADGGTCAYVVSGMPACDEQCAVALTDDEEARLFLRDVRDAEVTAFQDWADAVHVDDDPASTLPRSLPGRER